MVNCRLSNPGWEPWSEVTLKRGKRIYRNLWYKPTLGNSAVCLCRKPEYSKCFAILSLFHPKCTMDSETQNTNNQLGHLNPKLQSQFQDRRNPNAQRSTPGFERRQFTNSHSDLTPEAAELGQAIDQYKLQNRRRFINYEEMLGIIKSLGYEKQPSN